LYKAAHTHKTDPATVARALGFGGLNGSSLTMISALKKYGLLDEDAGQLRISKPALTMLVDPPESRERAKAILDAAFAPALFAEFRKEYGDRLPPNDQIVRAYLLKRGFSPATVDAPIRAYRDTLELVADADAIYNANGAELGAAPETDLSPPPEAAVGDTVQWEAGGVLRMEAPRKVRAIREHEGSKWVFVDGSETGIPMDEVIIEKRADPKVVGKVLPPTLPEEQMQVAVGQREREWLRGPLAKDTSYRLIVTGDIGPREIGKLIKLLEAQKAVLDEDGE
jgi:hypothetical protein